MHTELMRSFRGAKHFRNSSVQVSCIDFSFNGFNFLSCGQANELQLYNCKNGENNQLVPIYRCGIDLARFTLDNDQIIHSARKDCVLRLLDVTTNKYMRYFCGHTRRINSMSVASCEQNFVTSGMDGMVNMWDLRIPSASERIDISERSIVTYDPAALIITVFFCDSKQLKLYDVRLLGRRATPFVTFNYSAELQYNVTSMQFAPNGLSILFSTDGPLCYRVDAFNGGLLNTYTGRSNIQMVPIEACFSPKSKFVLSGSDDGRVCVWDAVDGIRVATFMGDNENTVSHIRFNPKHLMFASSSISTIFWIPVKNNKYDFELSFNKMRLH